MASNILLSERIKSLRGEQNTWSTVEHALQNNELDAALLKVFFKTWQSQGYEAAVAGLPHDDDPNIDITEEEIQDKAVHLLHADDWEAIANTPLQTNIDDVQAKIRQIVLKLMFVDSTMASIDSEIQDLTLAQQTGPLT